MHKQLMTLREAAAELDVAAHIVVYALVSGKAPEPERIGGRRMFTANDVMRLRRALSESADARPGKEGHERH